MMVMEQATRAFLFHSCARCGGDGFLDRAEDPAAWRCLQCGRVIDIGADGRTFVASAVPVE